MNLLEKILARQALTNGWFRFDEIECDLASGRKFRYQLQDYPFRVDSSEVELDQLACQIIKDKYRYCEWDRNHPKSNSEVEIFDAVKQWMVAWVTKAQQMRAEDEAAKNAEPVPASDQPHE
jgi:hypothetical protein